VIDAATKTITAAVSLGQDCDPFGMAIAGNKLYVAGTGGSAKVFVIELNSQAPGYHTVTRVIAVGTSAYDVVARPDVAYVYVSHYTEDGRVTVIDTADDSVETTIAMENPKGMALSGSILYVGNYGHGTITMINTQSNTKLILDSPLQSGGSYPENIAVSPDGEKIYVVDWFPGSVEILGY
jgi:DNA-binding beta-propeller fold protein YncE